MKRVMGTINIDVNKASSLMIPIIEEAYDYAFSSTFSDGTVRLDGTFDADLLRRIADVLDSCALDTVASREDYGRDARG